MLEKIKVIIENFKYLNKANFYIKKSQYLTLSLLTVLVIFAAFLTIYSTLPFIDLILNKDQNNYHLITKKLLAYLEYFNISSPLFFLGSLFLSSIIFKAVLEIAYEYFIRKIQMNYLRNESLEINKKIFNMNQSFYINNNTSKILNLYTKELDRTADVLSSVLLSLNFFLQLITYLITTFYINFTLTGIFFIILSTLLIPFIFINYLSLKLGIKSTKINNDYTKVLINNLAYSRFISTHGITSTANNLFLKVFGSYEKNKLGVTFLSSISTKYLQPAGILSIMAAVFLLSRGKGLTELTMIGSIIWGLTRVFGPINTLLALTNVISTEIFAFRNIYQTKNDFNEMAFINGKNEIKEINDISFEKVNFKYNQKDIFKNLSFKIKKGEKIAIIGETGSGKSTFLDLITNINLTDSGARKVNGIEFKDINFQNLRKKVSYISQTLPMLDLTIREYFEFYNENIMEKEIEEYLDFMNCYNFLPKNKDTLSIKMGDRGMRFSGGQKQKIILAAAFSRKPNILILDESTNAIDMLGENEIIKKITNIKDLIFIFISHKLTKEMLFNKIYILKDQNLILKNNI